MTAYDVCYDWIDKRTLNSDHMHITDYTYPHTPLCVFVHKMKSI